ncbi:hypothetical protein BDW66DRAFT_161352 [Aspergillus desertorum]
MMKATSHLRSLRHWLGNGPAVRGYASFPERLHHELTCRQLPLIFDYLQPQQSHLLDLTLTDLFPKLDAAPHAQTTLPTIARPSYLPPAHHLVYFPPQVTLSQLLADGTDTLHAPGAPFNRRLWAGGRVRLAVNNKLLLNGDRAVCIERIRDVIVKGKPGNEKIIVKIERHIGTVQEEETEQEIRDRIWSDGEYMKADASIVESRNLVFMRDKTADQLDEDKAKFSQASRTIKCYRNLLVHGPLTLALLLTALQHHLHGRGITVSDISYKNIAPLFVEEELAICGKPKPTGHGIWDVWIEGKDGAMDDFWALPPVARTLTALTFVQSALVHSHTLHYYFVPFFPQLIFKARPEIWRLFTPYLLTDPKLNVIFDLYFSMRTMVDSGTATFANGFIWEPGSSQTDNKGTKTMFFVIEIPTLLLPWARLALTFVMKGWHRASVELTGIVAAHLYDFLTRIYPTFGGGKNYIVTPSFVRRWFTRSLRAGQERVYGRAYRPPNEREKTGNWASSVRTAWDSRGSGRRLGGN